MDLSLNEQTIYINFNLNNIAYIFVINVPIDNIMQDIERIENANFRDL
jgi:hypothetical protein